MRISAYVALLLMVAAGPILHGQDVPSQQVPVTSVPGTVQPPAAGAPSQPAVAVTTVPSPASPQNPTDQVMWALAMSYLLRYVTKKRWIGFLTPEATQSIKAFTGFIVAAGTAAGIHFAVNGSPLDGHGASITISGLSFDVFKDVGFQWVSQQGWYDFVVKETSTTGVAIPPGVVPSVVLTPHVASPPNTIKIT